MCGMIIVGACIQKCVFRMRLIREIGLKTVVIIVIKHNYCENRLS